MDRKLGLRSAVMWLNSLFGFYALGVKKQEDGEYSDVRFLPAVGVVDNETGKYLPEYGQAIAGYLIIRVGYGAERKYYVDKQPLWFRKQYVVGCGNYLAHNLRQIARADKMKQRALTSTGFYDDYAEALPELTPEVLEGLPRSIIEIVMKTQT